MNERTDEARAFHRGIALFNAGAHFEAHEVWEDVWRPSSGTKRRFYQALIQSAVALEHRRRGNERGAQRVWARAKPKLDALPDRFLGLRVPRFRDAMEATMRAPGAPGPAIHLEHDPFG